MARRHVQAKNLFGKKFGVYRDLRSSSAARQANHLIRAASLDEAVPLYAFFNKEVPPFNTGAPVALRACAQGTLSRGAIGFPWKTGVSPLGVTIAHAQDVLNYVIPRPAVNQRAENVNPFAMPWECLFCPTCTHPWNGPSSDEPLIAAIARSIVSTNADEQETLIRTQPPAWTQLVQDGIDPSGQDPEAPDARYFLVINGDFDPPATESN